MKTDPPRVGKVADIIENICLELLGTTTYAERRLVFVRAARAVLAFADREPRPITEAMVDAAALEIVKGRQEEESWRDRGRAALKAAAEKACTP